ncbi:hypothetical protein GCM10027614_30540 [Micromonospora vulcania]
MGCADSILPLPHDCGGDKIPAQGLGWWCDCPKPMCRERQQGIWPAKPAGASNLTGRRPRRPT